MNRVSNGGPISRDHLGCHLADPLGLTVELESHLRVIRTLGTPAMLGSIGAAAEAMIASYAAGGKTIFFGNGGSAADSMHLAGEMLGRFLRERRPVAALALADNAAAVTAIGNDYGYDSTFARQIAAFAVPGDVAIGLSTSGRSENVARALTVASDHRLRTIALTGAHARQVGEAAEIVIAVQSEDVPRIQEAHMLIGHLLCDRVERTLAASVAELQELSAGA